jgi:hypothetical protein
VKKASVGSNRDIAVGGNQQLTTRQLGQLSPSMVHFKLSLSPADGAVSLIQLEPLNLIGAVDETTTLNLGGLNNSVRKL